MRAFASNTTVNLSNLWSNTATHLHSLLRYTSAYYLVKVIKRAAKATTWCSQCPPRTWNAPTSSGREHFRATYQKSFLLVNCLLKLMFLFDFISEKDSSHRMVAQACRSKATSTRTNTLTAVTDPFPITQATPELVLSNWTMWTRQSTCS